MKNLSLSFLVIFGLATLHSCGDTDPIGGEATDSFDRRALLVDLADNMIIPAYDNYLASVELLDQSVIDFTDSPAISSLEEVRRLWFDAYLSWQEVALFEIGHAEQIALRAYTNSYPTDTKVIDTKIASGEYNLDLPSSMDEQGFPAIEYLIYGKDATAEDILERFSNNQTSNYLLDLSTRLVVNASEVVADWQSDYRSSFIDNDGVSATSAINKIVNDYIFYYEKYLRAGKIGIPAGVFSGDPEPQTVEGLYADGVSKALFLKGLSSVEHFFNGKKYDSDSFGEGLSSYLDYLNIVKDGADLSTLINNQFGVIRATAQFLDDNIAEQISRDNNAMLSVYDELQKNVVYLKVDMLQALNVKVDYVDSDGD